MSKVKAMRDKFNTPPSGAPPGGKPQPLGPRPQIPKKKPPDVKPKASPANNEATSNTPSLPVQTSFGTKFVNSKSNLGATAKIETTKSNPGANSSVGTTNTFKPGESASGTPEPADSQEIMPKPTQLSVSKFVASANGQPAMSKFGSPKTNPPAEPIPRTPEKVPSMEAAQRPAPIEDDTSVILRKNSDKNIPGSDDPAPVAPTVGKLNIKKIFSENSFKPNIRTSNVVHSPSPIRDLETELQKTVDSIQKGKFTEPNNSKFPKRPSNRRSVKILTRKGDSRKFRKLEFSDLVQTFGSVPTKPPPLLNIDLSSIEANYRRSLLNTEYGDVLESFIEEEIDVTDNRVSLIPTMSAADEGNDDTISYPNGSGRHLPPPSVPDHNNEIEGVMDDYYEEFDEVQEKIRQIKEKEKQDEKKNNKEIEKKAKKEKEKQMRTEQEKLRKEKETLDKQMKNEQEKLRKGKDVLKREKKRQEEFKAKYSLSESDTAKGAGKIKSTPKQAKNFELNVHEGEEVEIICMTGKLPMGKWIVRNEEGKYGYVDSNNIEVDIATIHSVMEGSYVNIPRLAQQDGGEVEADADEFYEDVSN